MTNRDLFRASLIEAGANIDSAGDMSETPSHVAAGQENLPIIEALLKAGAKTNIRSGFNETAAERAKKKGEKLRNYSNGTSAPNTSAQSEALTRADGFQR